MLNRKPSSRDDLFSANQRLQFYSSLMPRNLQKETIIENSDFGIFQKACLQTEYGQWARQLKNAEYKRQKFAFLLSKLNRPFYFLFQPSNDSKLHIIGSLEDFKEVICVGLVLNEGNIADEVTSEVSTEFLVDVLQLPNINSQVLDLVFNLWDKGGKDSVTGQMIVDHPLFNQFNLHDLFVSLYKKPMAISSRMSILATILKTRIYKTYPAEFFPLILKESSNFIGSDERYLIFRLFLEEKNEVDSALLLNFGMIKVDASKDYTDLYQRLSVHSPAEEQFEILKKMLKAGANLPEAETLFLKIWKESSSRDLKDSMTVFAQSDMEKNHWFRRQTIHQVTIERLESPFSAKGVKTTLSNYSRADESSLDAKLKVLRLLANQESFFDAESTKSFIDFSYELRQTNPDIELAVTKAISFLGPRFKENDDVLESYIRYLKGMRNKKYEIELIKKMFPDSRIREPDLIIFARDAYLHKLENADAFIELVMTQPQISASGFSGIISILGPNKVTGFKPELSVEAKRILPIIVAHSKADAQVKEEANRFLNPVIKFIEDPKSR